MYLQGTFCRIKSSLTNFNLRLYILPQKAFQCLKNKHYQPARMSKVISRKPDKGAFPLNRKERVRNEQFNRGMAPKTDSMRVWVLKSGAFGGAKSVLLETTHHNYLFNCGEGIQRSLASSKIKVVQIDDIFLTHKSWANIGGLYGMLLTRAGANKFRGTEGVLRIHGPPQVEQILQMAKQFQDSPGVLGDVEKHEIISGSYSNYQVDVDYVKILKTSERQAKPIAETEYPETAEEKMMQYSPNEDTDFAVAYIIRPKPGSWKFDLVKLADINVKSRGPWMTELQKGVPHTLEDGRVLTREEVCIPPKPVAPIVILECPSQEYLESLFSSERLKKLSDAGEVEPQLIIHMTPSDIVDREDYQRFMKRYETTDHLLLNERSKDSVPHSAISFQQGLNNLHPDIFPNLYSCKIQAEHGERASSKIVQGEVEFKFNLRPYTVFKPGYDWSSCFALDRDISIAESFKDGRDDIRETVAAWKEELKNTPEPHNRREYPEVVFLGTASSMPGTTRNVTGILLHLSPEKCMLLDCGECTMEQIRCVYGDRADDVISKLAAIFISHLHADHHMGLFGVINARRQALERRGLPITRLPILAPILLQRWLYLYFRIIKNLFNEIELMRHVPDPGRTPATMSVHRSILDKLDLQEFTAIPVNHVPHAYGVSLTHRSGWKLCYSGDTTPCQRLVEGGKGCDLLIHEATFSEDLEHEALAKNHRPSQVNLDNLPTTAKLVPLLEGMFEKRLVQQRCKDGYFKDRFSKTQKRKFSDDDVDYTAVLEEIESMNAARKKQKDSKQRQTQVGETMERVSKTDRKTNETETKANEAERTTNKKRVVKKDRFESLLEDYDEDKGEIINIEETGNDFRDLEKEKDSNEYDVQDYNLLENIIGEDSNNEKDAEILTDASTGDNTDSVIVSETEWNVDSKDDRIMEQDSGGSIDTVERGACDNVGTDIDSVQDVKVQLKE